MMRLIPLILLSLFMVGCETMETRPNQCQALENTVNGNPRDAESIYELGRCYEDINRDQLALETYLNALNIRPTGKAYARAGILYFEQREYGLAESYLQKAVGYFLLPPDDALAHYYLGEIYRMQSKCTSSVNMYKKALALDPNLLDAQDGLNRAQREICRRSGGSSKQEVQPPPPPPVSTSTGGGRALKPGEW